MKITSDFAILDVKLGRHNLATHFEARPSLGPCPEDLRIPVTIVGYISGQHGRDDGTSIEFSVEVEHISLKPADVRFVVTSSMGVGLNPVFTTEAEARANTEIPSYIHKGTSWTAPVIRTITLSEELK